MSQDRAASDSHFPDVDGRAPCHFESQPDRLSVVRTSTTEEAKAPITQQLNEALTVLLLHLHEIKQHTYQFSPGPSKQTHLQLVVENAVQETERVCAIARQLLGSHVELGPCCKSGQKVESSRGSHIERRTSMMFTSDRASSLTKREREVLKLISEGYTNKHGSLRLNISPRAFESHRAEIMRKLGACNTADLVRKLLQQSIRLPSAQ